MNWGWSWVIWKIGESGAWLTCSTSLPEQNSCCKLIEGWNLQYIFSICTHFIINQPWCIKHNLLILGLTVGRSMYIQVCTLKRVLAETHTLCHEYPHHWCLSYPETCLFYSDNWRPYSKIGDPPPLTSFPSKIGDPYSLSHRLRHLQSLFIVQSMQHLRSVPPYPLSPFLSILEGQVPVGI